MISCRNIEGNTFNFCKIALILNPHNYLFICCKTIYLSISTKGEQNPVMNLDLLLEHSLFQVVEVVTLKCFGVGLGGMRVYKTKKNTDYVWVSKEQS